MISCIVPPPKPRIVTGYVPVGVIENVMKVSELALVAGFWLNIAKTPGGGFSAKRKTELLNPPSRVILIVVAAVEPCPTVKLPGDAESTKSGCDGGGAGTFTVRLIVVVLVRLPDVPVTVMLAVPAVAVLLAVRVKVLVEPVAGFGLKVAPTPVGNPEADRVTLPLKPFDRVIVIVLLPLEPCVTVTLLGEAESVKFCCGGGAVPLTVKLMFVVCVKLPEVPVTVTVTVPKTAVLPAVNVRTLEPVVGLALKLAVTPVGKLEFDKETLPLNPFMGVMVIVLVPLEPWATVKLLGEADKEKSG